MTKYDRCATVGDKLSCLRSASVDLLAQINDNMTLSGFFGTFTFTPVIDGKFIMKRISQLLREGNFNGEVVFANSNSFEGIHFVNPAHPLPLNIYVKNLFPNIGDAEIRRAVEIYSSIRKDPGGNTTLTMTNQAVAVHGEAILICPTYWLLQAFNGKTYKAEFAIPPGDHIIDVPYYWPSQGDGPEYKNPEFDAAFSSSFLNFAVFQDPVGNGTPTWDRWSNGKNGMVEMLFNKTEDGQPVIRAVQTDEGLLERCRFWESVGHVTGQ
ncbi:hypothetical protein AN958_00200 [Leucoagaricus sp. SymC.cos]|nr:hypothetical protein AN958_00200 [Leucoagaricus sp. SymC.cos]